MLHRIKTVISTAFLTYSLLYVGNALLRLGADLVEHFRKHPASS